MSGEVKNYECSKSNSRKRKDAKKEMLKHVHELDKKIDKRVENLMKRDIPEYNDKNRVWNGIAFVRIREALNFDLNREKDENETENSNQERTEIEEDSKGIVFLKYIPSYMVIPKDETQLKYKQPPFFK